MLKGLHGNTVNKTMLLLKVHKGHLIPQVRTYGYPNISVPYIIATSVPHFILLKFRSVKCTPPILCDYMVDFCMPGHIYTTHNSDRIH